MRTTLLVSAVLAAIVIALIFHEWAHAHFALREGDKTAKSLGRYTLNPLAHLHPMGTAMILIVGFGFAKPVPINPINFRRSSYSYFLVAIGGVILNFLIAFVAYPLLILTTHFAEVQYADITNAFIGYSYTVMFFTNFFFYLFTINLLLFVFNLLPIHPLDGFKVIESFSKRENPFLRFMRQYGAFLLLSFMLLGLFHENIIWAVLGFAQTIIGFPIAVFWNIILINLVGLSSSFGQTEGAINIVLAAAIMVVLIGIPIIAKVRYHIQHKGAVTGGYRAPVDAPKPKKEKKEKRSKQKKGKEISFGDFKESFDRHKNRKEEDSFGWRPDKYRPNSNEQNQQQNFNQQQNNQGNFNGQSGQQNNQQWQNNQRWQNQQNNQQQQWQNNQQNNQQQQWQGNQQQNNQQNNQGWQNNQQNNQQQQTQEYNQQTEWRNRQAQQPNADSQKADTQDNDDVIFPEFTSQVVDDFIDVDAFIKMQQDNEGSNENNEE